MSHDLSRTMSTESAKSQNLADVQNLNSKSESTEDRKDATESGPIEASSYVKRESTNAILDLESEEEEEEEEEIYGGEDNDFLSEYPDDTEELELVHSRITSCTPLNLPRFAHHLKKVCLRQNFISRLSPSDFNTLKELEELDFYDNKIKNVGDALDNLSKLRVLDLSFNLIKAIPESLASLTSLRTIYFVQNKISKIQNLEAVGLSLQSIELGGNRIRKIENLGSLTNLQELWLGKNKITQLENLGSLKRLRILSIQSNRLTRLEGLEDLVNLEELYLSHNGIEKLEGLDQNRKLRTLDAGNNRIRALENISHLLELEELWLNDNSIPDLRDVDSQLGGLKKLETVYLEGNPCQKSDMSGYRRKLILALPQVNQVDATMVK